MEVIPVSVCSDMNESCFSFCTNVTQLWVKHDVKLYLQKPILKLAIQKIRTTPQTSEKVQFKEKRS